MTTSQRPQWQDAVAGALSGALSRTVMAPVERIKLMKQLQTSGGEAVPKSAMQIAYQVYSEQGVYSFWRGNLASSLRVAGTAAVNFTCMDYYKRLGKSLVLGSSQEPTRLQQLTLSLVSGGLAGATSTTVMYPLEFIRTRMAMDPGGKTRQRLFRGMGDVVYKIVQTDGLTGLYAGYGSALVGGIWYRILLLGGHDASKAELLQYKRSRHLPEALSWGERLALAQIISLTAGTLSYPLDSVRRRMMMQSGSHQRLYRNSWHCVVTVLRTEGVSGFFLGLGPNIIRSLGGALLLVGYDAFKTLLMRKE
jgi:solute carrier family 25 (adenine nucleotide translocator) protein 4/5/6/31